jgi:riboflavin kinase/FMN adenylyltransferase
MRIISLPDAEPRPRHVAVGEFDGVHLGHREVMRGADTVLTFDPHPRAIIGPHVAPPLLTSMAAKSEVIAELGVQELVVIPFDETFAAQSPETFIQDVLVGRLGATQVSVGRDFRFGHRAAGDVGLLAAQDAFRTRIVDLVEVDGEIVSSGHIRALVAAGEVGSAGRLLGRPFQMRGPIAHGDKRGRTLGFPTANLVPDPALVCPGLGVYACRAAVHLDGGWTTWAAATSVGVRPTFLEGANVLVEANLLDFSGEIYGREIRVEFLERLRGEERFDSVDDLIEQMARDVEATRRIAA